MNTSVEISYYPLNEEYIPPILDFIKRLNGYNQLTVQTNEHEHTGIWRIF